MPTLLFSLNVLRDSIKGLYSRGSRGDILKKAGIVMSYFTIKCSIDGRLGLQCFELEKVVARSGYIMAVPSCNIINSVFLQIYKYSHTKTYQENKAKFNILRYTMMSTSKHLLQPNSHHNA